MRKGEIPSIDHGFMLGGDISSFGRLNRGSLAGIVTFELLGLAILLFSGICTLDAFNWSRYGNDNGKQVWPHEPLMQPDRLSIDLSSILIYCKSWGRYQETQYPIHSLLKYVTDIIQIRCVVILMIRYSPQKISRSGTGAHTCWVNPP